MAEKTYTFTKVTQGKIGEIEEKDKYTLKESELEDMHINLLLGQLMRDFDQCPDAVKLKFLQNIVKQHKTHKNENSNTESKNKEGTDSNDVGIS